MCHRDTGGKNKNEVVEEPKRRSGNYDANYKVPLTGWNCFESDIGNHSDSVNTDDRSHRQFEGSPQAAVVHPSTDSVFQPEDTTVKDVELSESVGPLIAGAIIAKIAHQPNNIHDGFEESESRDSQKHMVVPVKSNCFSGSDTEALVTETMDEKYKEDSEGFQGRSSHMENKRNESESKLTEMDSVPDSGYGLSDMDNTSDMSSIEMDRYEGKEGRWGGISSASKRDQLSPVRQHLVPCIPAKVAKQTDAQSSVHGTLDAARELEPTVGLLQIQANSTGAPQSDTTMELENNQSCPTNFPNVKMSEQSNDTRNIAFRQVEKEVFLKSGNQFTSDQDKTLANLNDKRIDVHSREDTIRKSQYEFVEYPNRRQYNASFEETMIRRDSCESSIDRHHIIVEKAQIQSHGLPALENIKNQMETSKFVKDCESSLEVNTYDTQNSDNTPTQQLENSIQAAVVHTNTLDVEKSESIASLTAGGNIAETDNLGLHDGLECSQIQDSHEVPTQRGQAPAKCGDAENSSVEQERSTGRIHSDSMRNLETKNCPGGNTERIPSFPSPPTSTSIEGDRSDSTVKKEGDSKHEKGKQKVKRSYKKKDHTLENEQRKERLLEWAERSAKETGCPLEDFKYKISFHTVEHKTYPCFVADHCIIFHDPKTSDHKIIYLTNENVRYKNNSNKLRQDHQVKIQYQMGVSNIKETIVLSPEGIEKPVRNDSSFEDIVELCHRYIFEVLAPAIVVFKNIQRAKELFSD